MTTLPLLEGVTADATLSTCGTYRYRLSRTWASTETGHVLWVMLNPSVGDAENDDRTLRRCQEFARSWGYDGITVANLFALRSKTPGVLKAHPDPVGPENDAHLQALFTADDVGLVVAAWGVHGAIRNRGLIVQRQAAELGRTLHALAITDGGRPGHPLYIPADTEPKVWNP